MNEKEHLEAARAKLETEREALRVLKEKHADACAELGERERQRLKAARDPAAYAEARDAEKEMREECDRLALLLRDVQPAAIAAGERALRSAQWLASSADFNATLERLRPAYEQALEAIAAHWSALSTLAALVAEANMHSQAMAKTGAPAPREISELVTRAALLPELTLPKENKLGSGETIVATIAAKMRGLLKLPANNTGAGYPASRQVLDMVAGRYRATLADFASRARGARGAL